MKQWYAKEFSKLTQVSVKTLHHYDKINLLKPSLRLSNRYRVYSEQDLLKLQQIIALKFFGFDLSQIKTLLTHNTDVLQNFTMQAKFLHEKAETLLQASTILKHITESCNRESPLPWEKIIQLIEVYRMTQQLENSWIKEVFNPEELEQYVQFESNLKFRFSEHEKNQFEKNWLHLITEIKDNLHQDPKSITGIRMGQQCMELINNLYGKENAHLRTIKWEKGFKEGKGLEEHGLTPDIVDWLDRAIDAYWHQRIYSFFDKIGQAPAAELLAAWNQLLEDMYGNSSTPKTELYEAVIHDQCISNEAKEWLKKIANL